MEAQQSLYEYLRQAQKQYSKEEIEKNEGSYDNDGFYILKDKKSFFDADGFFFENGYDDIGGYYDDYGVYVPPPEEFLEDDDDGMGDYYDELHGIYSEDEADEDGNQDDDDNHDNDFIIDEEEAETAVKLEHCLPALQFLEKQPSEKKHIIKIENVPRRATDANLLKYLQKKIPGFTHQVLGIERDSKLDYNQGVAYVQSTDVHTVSQLIKLHHSIFARYKLRTYLMGFPYSTDEEADEDKDDIQFQKNLLKHSLQELKHQSIVQQKVKKLREILEERNQANPEEPNTGKKEKVTYQEDDFEVTVAK